MFYIPTIAFIAKGGTAVGRIFVIWVMSEGIVRLMKSGSILLLTREAEPLKQIDTVSCNVRY